MKKLIVLLFAVGLVAGCETPGQTAMAGAATGAAIGAATTGQNETRGALIGAATGLAAGAAVAAARTIAAASDGCRGHRPCRLRETAGR